MTSITLPNDLIKDIRQHCREASPLEACGLLIGNLTDGVVSEIIASVNMSDSPEISFEIDPALILRAQKETRGQGQGIMGHYHSHPEGKAWPSVYDQKQNYDPTLVWLIVEVCGGEAGEMKAFATRHEGEALTEIPLCIR